MFAKLLMDESLVVVVVFVRRSTQKTVLETISLMRVLREGLFAISSHRKPIFTPLKIVPVMELPENRRIFSSVS